MGSKVAAIFDNEGDEAPGPVQGRTHTHHRADLVLFVGTGCGAGALVGANREGGVGERGGDAYVQRDMAAEAVEVAKKDVCRALRARGQTRRLPRDRRRGDHPLSRTARTTVATTASWTLVQAPPTGQRGRWSNMASSGSLATCAWET